MTARVAFAIDDRRPKAMRRSLPFIVLGVASMVCIAVAANRMTLCATAAARLSSTPNPSAARSAAPTAPLR